MESWKIGGIAILMIALIALLIWYFMPKDTNGRPRMHRMQIATPTPAPDVSF